MLVRQSCQNFAVSIVDLFSSLKVAPATKRDFQMSTVDVNGGLKQGHNNGTYNLPSTITLKEQGTADMILTLRLSPLVVTQ